ncbi:NTE family protein [Geomicrobium halophilum]|uniref:NTE family protein n=1 Tax=Geomicrobium halophilum TaxID=549000 RepID=A0A841PYH6_9BACL|nr:patatin-like phospholipase family protein [Geomicrobium halophilum]MBB6449402.1 NTE family protein [Geomicrobium halophilum]
MKNRPLIGLALGSGGARGIAHIGVLEVLEDYRIPVDFVAGSSMGALVGSLFAYGHSATDLTRMANLFRRKYYLDFTIPPKMGLINGKRLQELILMLSQGEDLDRLRTPVTVVTTDLNNGERVLFTSGSIAKAVRASISIPGIFVPVSHEGRLLVDGGVIDRVPASVVRDMGADIVIAVDVSYFPKNPANATIYDVIMQSMEIMGRELVRAKKINADILMQPIINQRSAVVFDDIQSLIEQGREEALRALPRIHEKMEGWKGRDHE